MKKIALFLVFFIIPLILFVFTDNINLFFQNLFNIDFKNYKCCNSWISNYLTIGSFMFAVQSFLIPFLKQSLYDSKKYKEYIEVEYGKNSDNERYRPLRNLSNFLFISTLLSFISALLMFIFIFAKKLVIIYLTFYCGMISFSSLIIALFLMQSNFVIMFSQKETNVT